MFALHYVPKNVNYYFLNCTLPRQNGQLMFDEEGNSVFLMTPLLLYIFLIPRRWNAFTAALLCGVVPLVAVLLLYSCTGWVQFGPRYLLDATPLLLLLAGAGMRGRLTSVGYALTVVALAAQLYGVSRVCRAEFGPATAWLNEWTVPALIVAALVGGLVARQRLSVRRPAHAQAGV